VFAYLDSRTDTFKSPAFQQPSKLTLLRTCNMLLKRLSKVGAGGKGAWGWVAHVPGSEAFTTLRWLAVDSPVDQPWLVARSLLCPPHLQPSAWCYPEVPFMSTRLERQRHAVPFCFNALPPAERQRHAVRPRAALLSQATLHMLPNVHCMPPRPPLQSANAMLCGRVLLFLAKLLPLTERSGVNLGGAFNTENATPVEEVQEVGWHGSRGSSSGTGATAFAGALHPTATLFCGLHAPPCPLLS